MSTPTQRGLALAALLSVIIAARVTAQSSTSSPQTTIGAVDSLNASIRGAAPPRARGAVLTASSALVAPGELHGVVLDAATRMPLAAVAVTDERNRRGASTDSLGRFRLRLSPDSAHGISTRRIGYARESHIVWMPRDSGRVALITLAKREDVCHAVRTGPQGERQPAVRVHVRMAALPEGRPLSPITISTRTMRGMDSVVVTMDYSLGAIVDLADRGPDMEYTVSIRGAGIREWRATATKPCGSRAPVEMDAWVFPR